MTTPTTTDRPPRAPGDRPSPGRHRRRNVGPDFGAGAPRTDATTAPESGDTSTPATSAQDVQDTPAGDEPCGIEPARIVPVLARVTIAGGALLVTAAGALGAIPPHRWPRVTLALTYLAIAGIAMLVGAGLSWAALRRPPADT